MKKIALAAALFVSMATVASAQSLKLASAGSAGVSFEMIIAAIIAAAAAGSLLSSTK